MSGLRLGAHPVGMPFWMNAKWSSASRASVPSIRVPMGIRPGRSFQSFRSTQRCVSGKSLLSELNLLCRCSPAVRGSYCASDPALLRFFFIFASGKQDLLTLLPSAMGKPPPYGVSNSSQIAYTRSHKGIKKSELSNFQESSGIKIYKKISVCLHNRLHRHKIAYICIGVSKPHTQEFLYKVRSKRPLCLRFISVYNNR